MPSPLDSFLADSAARVERALDRWVPPESARPALLHRAIRHSLFAGGKRIRPALCLAWARAAGDASDVPLYPAAAIECLHTYTLVHDDLPCMDDDDLRRGRPTCHKLFGEAIALLAGDALQALAFDLAARTPAPPSAVQRILAELARAAGPSAVVAGQVEDMSAPDSAPSGDTALDALEFIHLHKTADLILAASRMGVLAAGGDEALFDRASRYATALGLAFQCADDILDATSSAEVLGKTPGKDLAENKLTAVSLLGLDGARKRLASLSEAAAAEAAALPDPDSASLLSSLARSLAARRS